MSAAFSAAAADSSGQHVSSLSGTKGGGRGVGCDVGRLTVCLVGVNHIEHRVD